MFAAPKSGARFLPENHGQKRDAGIDRTSAIASTPARRSIAVKRSAGIFEWPIVKRSKAVIVRSVPRSGARSHTALRPGQSINNKELLAAVTALQALRDRTEICLKAVEACCVPCPAF